MAELLTKNLPEILQELITMVELNQMSIHAEAFGVSSGEIEEAIQEEHINQFQVLGSFYFEHHVLGDAAFWIVDDKPLDQVPIISFCQGECWIQAENIYDWTKQLIHHIQEKLEQREWEISRREKELKIDEEFFQMEKETFQRDHQAFIRYRGFIRKNRQLRWKLKSINRSPINFQKYKQIFETDKKALQQKKKKMQVEQQAVYEFLQKWSHTFRHDTNSENKEHLSQRLGELLNKEKYTIVI
ncbi:hypothetical protein [Thermoflavimicrobium daqui]|uniref:Uncharacterized protein n=1 Tax=Thermoflavimicrobium daqui TaxID=2137476 RepID=A0A364K4I2_9BACL|nr:hypothetical protein [Thermoflavimicrobium daqui]RAL24275.1 hypothetical protein DL897_11415 [Thermoflavimicrobium daqui]